MGRAEPSPAARGPGAAAGVAAVAATYVYFLLWAQFGFLHLLRSQLTTAEVQVAMGAMGVAGLLTSLTAAAVLRYHPFRPLLRRALVAAAAAALLALAAREVVTLSAAAALVGGATAAVTVTLATGLRRLLPGPGFGLKVGIGTGLAYFACNLPGIFEAPPALAAGLAAGLCLTAAAALGSGADRPRDTTTEPTGALRETDYRPLGFVAVLLSLLALIWLDSAAFVVIQETAALKGSTWGGGRTLVQGLVHLLAAVTAGRLVDRGVLRPLWLSAYALFAIAFTLLGALGNPAATGLFLLVAGPLYATGISFYSVALVVYPAYRPEGPGLVPVRWRAALVFGIAGWIGSAAGVGMAQDLHRVPRSFLLAAGLLLAGAWALARRRELRAAMTVHGITAAGGGLALALVGLMTFVSHVVHAGLGRTQPKVQSAVASPMANPGEIAERVSRGRQVYVEEGCINCHSQYVRPGGIDVRWWGPRRPLDRGQHPVLIGNRRQGPDLSNAGLRRSARWHRLHLIDPRALVPASRMPSYAGLFGEADRRGNDLVAYLASLGRGGEAERAETLRKLDATRTLAPGSTARGRELFSTWCAACHGAEGGGDGRFAAELDRPALDLRKDGFWWISGDLAGLPEPVALARIVRFGLEGTSMPGHEYLSEQQVADLVAFVETLPRREPMVEPSLAGAAGGRP